MNKEDSSPQVKEHSNLWLANYNQQLKEDADTISSVQVLLEQRPRWDSPPSEVWMHLVQKGSFALDALNGIWANEKSEENKECLESLLKDMLQLPVISEIGIESKEGINSWPIEKLPMLLAKLVDWKLRLYNHDLLISFEEYIDKELNTVAEIVRTKLQLRHPSRSDGCYPILSIIEEMKTIFTSPTEENQNALESTISTEFSLSTKRRASSCPFVGNTINYYAVSNSMIHKVLFFRTGIPITLSIIYAAIVRRATGIRFDPLGIPGHFLLSTVISDEQTNIEERIFIDVFGGGSMMTLNDAQQLLHLNFGVSWSSSFLIPVSNIEICSRMVRNILNCQDLSLSEASSVHSFLEFLSMKK
jgi:hypothetical protein